MEYNTSNHPPPPRSRTLVKAFTSRRIRRIRRICGSLKGFHLNFSERILSTIMYYTCSSQTHSNSTFFWVVKKSKSTFWVLLKCLNNNQITLILRISNFERYFSDWVYVLWGDRNSKNHMQYKKKPTKLKMLRRRRLAFCSPIGKNGSHQWIESSFLRIIIA